MKREREREEGGTEEETLHMQVHAFPFSSFSVGWWQSHETVLCPLQPPARARDDNFSQLHFLALLLSVLVCQQSANRASLSMNAIPFLSFLSLLHPSSLFLPSPLHAHASLLARSLVFVSVILPL